MIELLKNDVYVSLCRGLQYVLSSYWLRPLLWTIADMHWGSDNPRYVGCDGSKLGSGRPWETLTLTIHFVTSDFIAWKTSSQAYKLHFSTGDRCMYNTQWIIYLLTCNQSQTAKFTGVIKLNNIDSYLALQYISQDQRDRRQIQIHLNQEYHSSSLTSYKVRITKHKYILIVVVIVIHPCLNKVNWI